MASIQMTAEDILDESIEQAKSSLQSQELLNQAQDVVIANDKAGAGKMTMSAAPDQSPVTGFQAGKMVWPPLPQLTLVRGVLTNKTKEDLSVMHDHKYEGHTVTRYPNPLHISGHFSLAGWTAKGVKAAVVYSGKNKHGVKCGWLLAFADTKHTGRRIYAECGRKEKFTKVDWAEVEKKLNNAGALAKAYDMSTGTSFFAAITEPVDKSANSVGRSAIGAVYLG